MSIFRHGSSSSNKGTKSSSISQKKPSFLVRFIKGTFFQMFVFFTTIILLGVGYAAWTTLDRNDAANGKPVTQNLMQGIIDNINDLDNRIGTLMSNLTTLSNRVIAINPSGTTLSGSSVCIGGVCKTGWVTGNGIGYGQTWQDVTSSRFGYTDYTNNTGKPIMVNYHYYQLYGPLNNGVSALIDGVRIYGTTGVQGYSSNNLTFIVPNGSTYRVEGYNPSNWVELR